MKPIERLVLATYLTKSAMSQLTNMATTQRPAFSDRLQRGITHGAAGAGIGLGAGALGATGVLAAMAAAARGKFLPEAQVLQSLSKLSPELEGVVGSLKPKLTDVMQHLLAQEGTQYSMPLSETLGALTAGSGAAGGLLGGAHGLLSNKRVPR